jgi:uncharacterized protein YegL
MRKNYTHIAIVLDKSSSMSTVRDATISGFNEFLATQQAAEVEATITLTMFASHVNVHEQFQDIKTIMPLDRETYQPDGMTALYDAIGMTIKSVGKVLNRTQEALRPSKVIIAIMTDGGENSSKSYSASLVREMIEHQQSKYKWEFVFIGANQDAVLTATAFGINAANAMTYRHDAKGTTDMFRSLAQNTVAYATGASATMAFTDADLQAQK